MANTKLKVYDPAEVLIVFGAITIDGFADGEFLNIVDDEDESSTQFGTDGEAVVTPSNNRGATITITTLQESEANTLLSAQRNLGRNQGGGPVKLPLFIRSNNATFAAELAWIQKGPSRAFGREAGPRDWVLRTNHLISIDAGSAAQ